MDKPALSAEDKQLCVEGLKHGERYSVTLRAGPAVDRQGDAVEVRRPHDLCARPQAVRALRRQGLRAAAHRPARHSGGQRQHQRGRRSTIYRIGDRNLIDTVLGRDFQRNLDRYDIERLTESRGIKVWNGELAVEQTLNAEVTTAFPVDQAVGDMRPASM